VTGHDYFSAIALMVSIAAFLYRRGGIEQKTEARIVDLERRMIEESDGLGKLARDIRSKEERRWKQQICASVEAAETLEQAKRFVDQLKQDSFRE
jgi:hypothetical protein